jgi:hypothetical protein
MACAGVIEIGQWSETVQETAQGASPSPLLANVYLHYVLDLWADQWRRHAHGDMIIVRFADDCVPRTLKEESMVRVQVVAGSGRDRLLRGVVMECAATARGSGQDRSRGWA